MTNFYFGLEHEIAFLNEHGDFADFSQISFNDLDQIIKCMPKYAEDYPQLRIGDAGIKVKRWYIEGFERFADSEIPVDCVPKGIEIRTTIHNSIQGVISELTESFDLLRNTVSSFGFQPVLISYNPYRKKFEPMPPLNEYERNRRKSSPEKQTANIPMVTYGPDLNLSIPGIPIDQLIDMGQKLTYYSPYIVPFSFSSPFYGGELWHGLSVRTYKRTGQRPAVMVFIDEPVRLLNTVPSLTKIARVPAEAGRIEFKAFDSCDDFAIYAGLFVLLKGLIVEQTLSGRAMIPSVELHKIAAQEGFDNQQIFQTATNILEVVKDTLMQDPDVSLLKPLERFIEKRETPAKKLVDGFKRTGSIAQVLQATYLKS